MPLFRRPRCNPTNWIPFFHFVSVAMENERKRKIILCASNANLLLQTTNARKSLDAVRLVCNEYVRDNSETIDIVITVYSIIFDYIIVYIIHKIYLHGYSTNPHVPFPRESWRSDHGCVTNYAYTKVANCEYVTD